MSTRVLVVDDTVVFRRIISDALAGAPGVEVVGTASNGRLALARMAALEPDLVTLDIEMPEMNGIEVLEAMAAAGIKAGVIMLSALTVKGGEMTVRASSWAPSISSPSPTAATARRTWTFCAPACCRWSEPSNGAGTSARFCAVTHREPRWNPSRRRPRPHSSSRCGGYRAEGSPWC